MPDVFNLRYSILNEPGPIPDSEEYPYVFDNRIEGTTYSYNSSRIAINDDGYAVIAALDGNGKIHFKRYLF